MENEKIIEKIDRKLTLYALYNSEGNSFDCLSLSFSDKEAVDYYYSNFKLILNNMVKKKDKNNYDILLSRLDNTSVYRIGYFNQLTGEFVNDKLYLAKFEKSLFTKKIKIKEEKINESK